MYSFLNNLNLQESFGLVFYALLEFEQGLTSESLLALTGASEDVLRDAVAWIDETLDFIRNVTY